jgi:hypothetical protein
MSEEITPATVRTLLDNATPGPWHVSEHRAMEIWADRDPGGWDAFMVATTSTRLNRDGTDTSYGDAELIAAAPQIAIAYLELARRRQSDEFVDQILQILSEAYRNGWTPDTIIEQAREVASWLD